MPDTSFDKNTGTISSATPTPSTADLNSAGQDTPTVSSDLGYIHGYGTYTSYTGAHTKDGKSQEVTITRGAEQIKTVYEPKNLDTHIDVFRKIYGFGSNSDDYSNIEDPAYLIFDLKILTFVSPLFNNVQGFIDSYTQYVPELNERDNGTTGIII